MKISEITSKNKTICNIHNLDVKVLYKKLTITIRSRDYLIDFKSDTILNECIKLHLTIKKILTPGLFDPNDFELNQTLKKIKELLPELEQLIKEIR